MTDWILLLGITCAFTGLLAIGGAICAWLERRLGDEGGRA